MSDKTPDEVLATFDQWQPISGEAKARHEAQSHIAKALREAIGQRDQARACLDNDGGECYGWKLEKERREAAEKKLAEMEARLAAAQIECSKSWTTKNRYRAALEKIVQVHDWPKRPDYAVEVARSALTPSIPADAEGVEQETP